MRDPGGEGIMQDREVMESTIDDDDIEEDVEQEDEEDIGL